MEKKSAKTNKVKGKEEIKDEGKILDIWLKINVRINGELEKLKILDAEREEIRNNLDKLSQEEIKSQMDASIKKYEKVLSNLKTLKSQAEKLKNLIKQKK